MFPAKKNRILVLAESCSRCTKICLCRARRTLANDARVPNRQSRVLTASRRAHPQSRHRAHSSHSNYYTYFTNYENYYCSCSACASPCASAIAPSTAWATAAATTPTTTSTTINTGIYTPAHGTQQESRMRRSRPALPHRRGGRGGRPLSPAAGGDMAVDRPRGQFLGDQLHFYQPAQAGSLRRPSAERAGHLDARRHALAQQRIHASFSAHHHSLMQLQHRHRPTSVPSQTRASRRRQGTSSGRSSCTNALSDRTSGLQALTSRAAGRGRASDRFTGRSRASERNAGRPASSARTTRRSDYLWPR